MRERASEHKQGGGVEGKGEADSQISRDPDVRLNPKTVGSRPEPKADT